MFSILEFSDGIVSGFVNYKHNSSQSFKPRLVLNDPGNGQKVLGYILKNIETCDRFVMAVAFLTRSGLACLYQTLKEFGHRGGEGSILISTYLNFSDPTAIELLSKIKGISVFFVNAPNFHGKMYTFEHSEYSEIMIGSSNLTQNALGKNTEVNIGFFMHRDSGLYKEIIDQTNHWFDQSEMVSEDNINAYKKKWGEARTKIKAFEYSSEKSIKIVPNEMQKTALEKLDATRKSGKNCSLVISATGTGKTILSAFDVKSFNPKRMLFVVHRLNIAKKALSEFRRVFGDSRSMGIYSAGDDLNKEADFIFSTIQTISMDRYLNNFQPNEFDYIIIDETHRAGAITYNKIMKHFNPKFLLGMTATPERTDGFDIFSLFNHTIACEIRLKNALEADLLAPFHYFGVTDLIIDGVEVDEKSDFKKLTSKDRVDHIIKKVNEYGCDSGVVRGLVFCSLVEEARDLSKLFNDRGYCTIALTGSDSENTREEAIRRLESDTDDKIDYIFTVDVFNEGVDIPRVNQIVMIRPTNSSIVFVQQLGRGLRKSSGKEYVTVIDFIGNYNNNYLIPIALFGDTSYNKDTMRRLVTTGSNLIPGSSSISFEKIARDRIFTSIESAKINTKKHLNEDFNLLKFRIGRNPMMMDFIKNYSREPYHYVAHAGSMLAFTTMIDKDLKCNSMHLNILEYLSKHVCDGIRLEESIIIEGIANKNIIDFDYVIKEIEKIAGFKSSNAAIISAVHNINLNFITERSGNQNRRVSDVTGLKLVEINTESNTIKISDSLLSCIEDSLSCEYLMDLVRFSTHRFLSGFCLGNYVNGFNRGAKYTRKDVFRILQWDKLPNAQNVGGYIISADGKNCPVFLTYNKEDHLSETKKYEDRFISPNHIVYMSKNRRTISSPDVISMRDHCKTGMRMPLFVKKNNDEGLGFYYLGELSAIENSFTETLMAGDVSVVKMEYNLDKDIDYGLYKHLTNN